MNIFVSGLLLFLLVVVGVVLELVKFEVDVGIGDWLLLLLEVLDEKICDWGEGGVRLLRVEREGDGKLVGLFWGIGVVGVVFLVVLRYEVGYGVVMEDWFLLRMSLCIFGVWLLFFSEFVLKGVFVLFWLVDLRVGCLSLGILCCVFSLDGVWWFIFIGWLVVFGKVVLIFCVVVWIGLSLFFVVVFEVEVGFGEFFDCLVLDFFLLLFVVIFGVIEKNFFFDWGWEIFGVVVLVVVLLVEWYLFDKEFFDELVCVLWSDFGCCGFFVVVLILWFFVWLFGKIDMLGFIGIFLKVVWVVFLKLCLWLFEVRGLFGVILMEVCCGVVCVVIFVYVLGFLFVDFNWLNVDFRFMGLFMLIIDFCFEFFCGGFGGGGEVVYGFG